MTLEEWTSALRADPESEAMRLAFSDWMEEHPHIDNGGWAIDALRAGKIPCTEVDEAVISALANCRFSPGSWPKRFARGIHDRVTTAAQKNENLTLTPRQYVALWNLVWHFRRQIPERWWKLCPRKPGDAKLTTRPVKLLPAPAFRSWADEHLPLTHP